MKKGQMSLEMIIGLLILLVVAIVVIRLFLTNIIKMDTPGKSIDDVLKQKGFQSECESLCNEYLIGGSQATLAQYCYTKMSGDADLNRNGKIDTIKAKTKILDICEDAVYCFHIIPCKSDTGTIGWDDCRQVVCQAYYGVYRDLIKTDQKVFDLFPSAGTCQLKEDENWWNMYFGPSPCITPGVTQLSLGACAVSSIAANQFSFSCNNIPSPDITKISTCTRGLVGFGDPDNGIIAIGYMNPPTGTSPVFGSVSLSGSSLSGTLDVPSGFTAPTTCSRLEFGCDQNWDGTNEFDAYSSSCTLT